MVGMSEDDCSPSSPLPADAVVVSRARPSVAQTVEIVPSRTFDPSAEETLRWVIALTTSCRPYHRDWYSIHLRAHEGKLTYLLSGPSVTLPSLLPRLPSGLTVREPPRIPPLALLESATARLVLPASPRAVPVSPDPLGDFARVFAQVDAREFAEVVVSLSPARGHSRNSLPDAPPSRSGNGANILFAALAGNVSPKIQQVSRGPKGAVSAERFLRVAVESRGVSASPERSRELALACLAPFHAWEPSGSLRVTSERGASEPVRPSLRGSRVVPSATVAGLLLPPTSSCTAPNVARTAASAPVPAGLPLLGPGVWPLGTPEGYSTPMGVPVREVLFGAVVGKPEWGKTTMLKTQFLAVTRQWPGHAEPPLAGGAVIDPHIDAVQDLIPFYWATPERVLLANFGGPWEGMRTPIYNPLDCRNLDGSWISPKEAEARVSTIVGTLAVIADWDRRATRSRPIATKAAELLMAMSLGLGPEDPVPTIFQIPWVLTMSPKERGDLIRDPRIPQSLRRWWENEGSAYKDIDFAPITQVISRIWASQPLRAFLGGRSTFTPRWAMDNKMVMLFGGLLGGDKEQNRLPVSLILRMLIQAAYSRGDVPREIRAKVCPPFYCFVDELPTCDGPDLAAIFMELRKFLFRLIVAGVSPAAFSKATWGAAVIASSIITTTSVDGEGAAKLTALGAWKGFDVRDLDGIRKYHHLTSVTFGEAKHPPFAVKGIEPEEIFDARPGVVEAHIAQDQTRYRDVASVVADLEDLDERLLEAWTGGRRSGAVSVDVPVEDDHE